MPKTLTVPKQEVRDLLAEVTAKYHPELAAAGVTVGLLAQWPGENDDPDEPCLKLHGYGCAAVVKVTPYPQRVQGIADAVITLDGPGWKKLSAAEQTALLDHELTHLELALDSEGNPKGDDHGRPKLKMRLHDVQAGWFVDVARRHGPASFEVKQARAVHADYYQQLFAWSDDMAGDRDGGDGDGVSAVTFSAGNKSVTVTGEQFSKLAARMGQAAGR